MNMICVSVSDAHKSLDPPVLMGWRLFCRGSKWMDYDSWRIFLEELTWRKRLNLEYVIEKLESTGKPYIINATINRGWIEWRRRVRGKRGMCKWRQFSGGEGGLATFWRMVVAWFLYCKLRQEVNNHEKLAEVICTWPLTRSRSLVRPSVRKFNESPDIVTLLFRHVSKYFAAIILRHISIQTVTISGDHCSNYTMSSTCTN